MKKDKYITEIKVNRINSNTFSKNITTKKNGIVVRKTTETIRVKKKPKTFYFTNLLKKFKVQKKKNIQ